MKKETKMIIVALCLVISFILGAAAGYMFCKMNDMQKNNEEIQTETDTIATITDVEIATEDNAKVLYVEELDVTTTENETTTEEATTEAKKPTTRERITTEAPSTVAPVVTEEPDPQPEQREPEDTESVESTDTTEDTEAPATTEAPADNKTLLGTYQLTAYTWTGNRMANGQYPYIGAVACNSLALGTVIYIEGYGTYTVCDRGGMAGNVIDIYMNSYNECIQFGRRNAKVYLVK